MALRIAGMNSGMDTEAMVQELVKSYSSKTETIKKDQTKAEWKQDALKSMNSKVKNFYSKYVSNLQYSTAFNKKTTSVSDSSKLTVITGDNAVRGSQTVEVKQMAKAAYLTGGQISKAGGGSVTGSTKLSELGFNGGDNADGTTTIKLKQGGQDVDITLSKDDTLDNVAKKFADRGLNANFDSNTGRLFISAKESGAASDFDITATDEQGYGALSALGLGKAQVVTETGQTTEVFSGGATKIDGQDAKILLNGAEFTSSNNSFNINGLTLTAKDVTSAPISINTETDYDGIYDTIKGFVKEYSSLINELDKLYNADSAKGYEPLTSEEKEALTDEEVEKWEEKIKSSLLRRNDTVSSIASVLKEAMSSTYEVNGKTLSLSNFGIETLGYFNSGENEKNMYHIDGDPDDESTAGKTDKLKAAIATNPEEVSSFFQKLASNMYSKMQEMTWSTDDRSYGSFYDDKKVKKEYEAYETKLEDWEAYVAKIEDKYYKQFTAMETAMAKLNSQQSYLSTMYGM
ncbi:MAG: flagellar filament capping protein FliD [Lachnospiraceae bacterium]|nr:flagellar filament capping protein FliD [Lachnospiraceae bacterium]